jgi:signal transduction histidine kinase
MRNRIVRVAVLSTAIALVLFLLPLAIAVFNLSVADARSQLERDALTAVARIDPQFSANDRTEIPRPTDSSAQLGLYDSSGKLVAGTGPNRADAPVRQTLSGSTAQRMSGDALVDVVPVTSSEHTVGAVRASIPLGVVVAGDFAVWGIMLLAAAVCLLVGILIARGAARLVAAPMEDLARTAQALGQGDFQARTTPSGVTEIDAAGFALGITANHLGALVERERRLSQDASHQLRTPLAGLRALLENAQTDPLGATPLVVEQAVERVDALGATIDDFLAADRRPHGRPTDLASEARALDRRWHGVFAADGRPLRLDVPDTFQQVVTVPALVQQILDVLLDNARIHGAGQVVVRVRDSHGAAAIDVEDEGSTIGLDADVFRRGYSGAGRSGLGLALAQQLAGDLGGRLLLSAREPRTRFTLILPRDGESADRAQDSADHESRPRDPNP